MKLKEKKENIINFEDRAEEINISSDKKLIEKIISKLKNYLVENKNIPGISAPQLGYNKRIFCINFNGDIRAFINPIISKRKGLHLSREIKLEEPEKEFIVPRSDEIIIIYTDPTFKPQTNKLEGYASEVFEALTNILDGISSVTSGFEIDEAFDNASEEERQELLDFYIDSLKKLSEELNKEIEETPELKEMSKAIDFMTKVQLGEVTLEKDLVKTSKLIKDSNKLKMKEFLNKKRKK